MSKISKHFIVEELVPESFFKKYQGRSRWFIQPQLLSLIDFFRERFSVPVLINDWKFGGDFQYSGFRPSDCAIGAKYSQHKLGAAADMKFEGMLVQEVYHDIMNNQELYQEAGLRAVESISYTTAGNAWGGWIHADVRNTGKSKLLIVKP